ncbi:acyltransferase [Microbacterium sp. NPDC087591]|uniref:acyltransferase family protein n=1 Tax=Microbacterium sp. NPDC087591 TaxID=3364192 RepID=UPI0038308BFD
MTIAPAPFTAAPSPPSRGIRDTGIDFVRALCVIGVVLLHAIMVGVTVTDGGPVFANASEGSAWITPLSWALQVMPLFFVIGGFSGLIAYRRARERGGSARSFVAARLHRLLRPAAVTIGVVALALAVLTVLGVPADLLAIAGFRYGQPLWFLAVFLMCQALLPALASAHDRAPLRTIGLLAFAAITVDGLRATIGIDAVGFLNLAFVWMALQQLGFFLADGRIDALSRRTRAVAGLIALGVLILTFVTGIYSPDLIANINPPTAALLLVGVVHTSALSLLRDRLERISRRPVPSALTAFVTPRTMSIYLWHMPVLLVMAGITAMSALIGGHGLPALGTLDWWAARPLWLALALGLTALVAVSTARFERLPAPDCSTSSARVGTAVLLGLLGVLLLLVLGTSVATAAIALALVLPALRLAQTRSSAARSAVG